MPDQKFTVTGATERGHPVYIHGCRKPPYENLLWLTIIIVIGHNGLAVPAETWSEALLTKL